jgi:TusE/DsrC/DsvC family sulfur relay protein
MSGASIKLPGGKLLAIDEKGYLLDWLAWSEEVAHTMAASDGIKLNPDHQEVLKIFRAYFKQYEIEPPMRALVKISRERLGEDKGNSRYLYRLFPDGPTLQACRYAGLPRPVSCI